MDRYSLSEPRRYPWLHFATCLLQKPVLLWIKRYNSQRGQCTEPRQQRAVVFSSFLFIRHWKFFQRPRFFQRLRFSQRLRFFQRSKFSRRPKFFQRPRFFQRLRFSQRLRFFQRRKFSRRPNLFQRLRFLIHFHIYTHAVSKRASHSDDDRHSLCLVYS